MKNLKQKIALLEKDVSQCKLSHELSKDRTFRVLGIPGCRTVSKRSVP